MSHYINSLDHIIDCSRPLTIFEDIGQFADYLEQGSGSAYNKQIRHIRNIYKELDNINKRAFEQGLHREFKAAMAKSVGRDDWMDYIRSPQFNVEDLHQMAHGAEKFEDQYLSKDYVGDASLPKPGVTIPDDSLEYHNIGGKEFRPDENITISCLTMQKGGRSSREFLHLDPNTSILTRRDKLVSMLKKIPRLDLINILKNKYKENLRLIRDAHTELDSEDAEHLALTYAMYGGSDVTDDNENMPFVGVIAQLANNPRPLSDRAEIIWRMNHINEYPPETQDIIRQHVYEWYNRLGVSISSFADGNREGQRKADAREIASKMSGIMLNQDIFNNIIDGLVLLSIYVPNASFASDVISALRDMNIGHDAGELYTIWIKRLETPRLTDKSEADVASPIETTLSTTIIQYIQRIINYIGMVRLGPSFATARNFDPTYMKSGENIYDWMQYVIQYNDRLARYIDILKKRLIGSPSFRNNPVAIKQAVDKKEWNMIAKNLGLITRPNFAAEFENFKRELLSMAASVKN